MPVRLNSRTCGVEKERAAQRVGQSRIARVRVSPRVPFVQAGGSTFFPALLSDEALFDPQEKRRNFDWAW